MKEHVDSDERNTIDSYFQAYIGVLGSKGLYQQRDTIASCHELRTCVQHNLEMIALEQSARGQEHVVTCSPSLGLVKTFARRYLVHLLVHSKGSIGSVVSKWAHRHYRLHLRY
jgi:hypothetical protein